MEKDKFTVKISKHVWKYVIKGLTFLDKIQNNFPSSKRSLAFSSSIVIYIW